MTVWGFPDISGFFDTLYGAAGVDLGGITCMYFGNSKGLVFPGNPQFTLTDFLLFYPKFGGPPINATNLTIVINNDVISGFTDTQMSSFAMGQLVLNVNCIPKDTVITSVNSDAKTITISNLPVAGGTSLVIYPAPRVPLVAMLSFLNLAQASIASNRYFEAWHMAMCYFIAHFCTMYMRTESGYQNYTEIQAVQSGLTMGITISQNAGDVSFTSKLIDGFDEWGAWRETQYGELLITLARSVSAGPIFVR